MKLKSHSGLKKRIKITGRGKFLFRKPCKNHLLINKSKRQKELYRSGKSATPGDHERVKKLLPYS